MQREMDFTDLIDWGREADLAVVTLSLPQCRVRLLDVLWCKVRCISCPRAQYEKVKHNMKWLIAMYLIENTRFLAHSS